MCKLNYRVDIIDIVCEWKFEGIWVYFSVYCMCVYYSVSIRPKAERFARRRRALCSGAKRLCYCPP